MKTDYGSRLLINYFVLESYSFHSFSNTKQHCILWRNVFYRHGAKARLYSSCIRNDHNQSPIKRWHGLTSPSAPHFRFMRLRFLLGKSNYVLAIVFFVVIWVFCAGIRFFIFSVIVRFLVLMIANHRASRPSSKILELGLLQMMPPFHFSEAEHMTFPKQSLPT